MKSLQLAVLLQAMNLVLKVYNVHKVQYKHENPRTSACVEMVVQSEYHRKPNSTEKQKSRLSNIADYLVVPSEIQPISLSTRNVVPVSRDSH